MDICSLFASVEALPLADAAARYASAGVPVFPCVPGGKRPLTPHGFLDASTDLGQVRAWWARWPDANLGVPTGAASQLDVIDIDVKGTVSGFSGFARARAAGLVPGWVAIVRTPSGGAHVFYPADSDVRQPSWQAPRVGIDFRGAGGFVVAAPSLLATDRAPASYRLLAAGTPPPGPVDATSLRSFLDPRATTPPVVLRPVDAQVEVERIARWVSLREMGERNRGLFWAACRLAEAGMAVEDTRAVLGSAAEQAGLPVPEIAATIRSAYRSATGTLNSRSEPRFGTLTSRSVPGAVLS